MTAGVSGSLFLGDSEDEGDFEGEEPPRVLHFNPRLKGDWSWKPVIELNTCYRMHWGTALRCDGWKSRAGEDTGKKNYVYIHYGCDV